MAGVTRNAMWTRTRWARFPEGIKSDATAAHYLMFDEGYNKSAADSLVAEFKATAAYAGIYEPDSIPVILTQNEGSDDQDEDESDEVLPPSGTPVVANPKGKVPVMETERVAFIEENQPGQYLKLIASGEFDDSMLEALEDFVKRQRKRLSRGASTGGADEKGGDRDPVLESGNR